MTATADLGGVFTPAGTTLALKRIGYGAIQLTGPMAWGPPGDRGEAVAVLRETLRLGINHIDTSDYYGPAIANEIIREALHPYPEELTIVTKVGARRGPDKSWPAALSRHELIDAVHDNLRHLRLDALAVVNLLCVAFKQRTCMPKRSWFRGVARQDICISASATSRPATVEARRSPNRLRRTTTTVPVDDPFIADLAGKGMPVPFFPLGGFRPLQSPILDAVAAALDATTRQVALAWLLQRSPNVLIIAGTSSTKHLRENLKAATLQLPPETVVRLDEIAQAPKERAGPALR